MYMIFNSTTNTTTLQNSFSKLLGLSINTVSNNNIENRSKNNKLIIKNTSDKTKDHCQINRIKLKLRAGKKLSKTDLAYLRKHAPKLYIKAVKIELDRKELKMKLESSKTKEEARNQIYSNIPDINNKDETAGYSEAAKMNTIKKYVKSEKYQNLPEKKDKENTVLLNKQQKKLCETEIEHTNLCEPNQSFKLHGMDVFNRMFDYYQTNLHQTEKNSSSYLVSKHSDTETRRSLKKHHRLNYKI